MLKVPSTSNCGESTNKNFGGKALGRLNPRRIWQNQPGRLNIFPCNSNKSSIDVNGIPKTVKIKTQLQSIGFKKFLFFLKESLELLLFTFTLLPLRILLLLFMVLLQSLYNATSDQEEESTEVKHVTRECLLPSLRKSASARTFHQPTPTLTQTSIAYSPTESDFSRISSVKTNHQIRNVNPPPRQKYRRCSDDTTSTTLHEHHKRRKGRILAVDQDRVRRRHYSPVPKHYNSTSNHKKGIKHKILSCICHTYELSDEFDSEDDFSSDGRYQVNCFAPVPSGAPQCKLIESNHNYTQSLVKSKSQMDLGSKQHFAYTDLDERRLLRNLKIADEINLMSTGKRSSKGLSTSFKHLALCLYHLIILYLLLLLPCCIHLMLGKGIAERRSLIIANWRSIPGWDQTNRDLENFFQEWRESIVRIITRKLFDRTGPSWNVITPKQDAAVRPNLIIFERAKWMLNLKQIYSFMSEVLNVYINFVTNCLLNNFHTRSIIEFFIPVYSYVRSFFPWAWTIINVVFLFLSHLCVFTIAQLYSISFDIMSVIVKLNRPGSRSEKQNITQEKKVTSSRKDEPRMDAGEILVNNITAPFKSWRDQFGCNKQTIEVKTESKNSALLKPFKLSPTNSCTTWHSFGSTQTSRFGDPAAEFTKLQTVKTDLEDYLKNLSHEKDTNLKNLMEDFLKIRSTSDVTAT